MLKNSLVGLGAALARSQGHHNVVRLNFAQGLQRIPVAKIQRQRLKAIGQAGNIAARTDYAPTPLEKILAQGRAQLAASDQQKRFFHVLSGPTPKARYNT